MPTVGASGAIFGLLLAFGILHAESEIMLFPLPFMIKAKYFIIGLIFIEVCLMLSAAHQPGESVAYMAHMGGLLFGYIWLKFVPRRGFALCDVGARLWIAQFVLPLEAQARRAQVRSLHAQA